MFVRLAALAVAVAFTVVACTPSDTPPPPPANAQELTQAGAYDQRIEDVTQELRDALELRYGPLEIRSYKLPPPTAWPTVSTYYRDALSKWDAEPGLSEAIRTAHALAWARDGNLFAIALIDRPVAGEHRDYKVLVIATNPS